MSYGQVIAVHPDGGGAYAISRPVLPGRAHAGCGVRSRSPRGGATGERPAGRARRLSCRTRLARCPGLAWVDGADGYVALDDRTGRPRAQKLADYPLLALPGEQVKHGDTGLVATPLPR